MGRLSVTVEDIQSLVERHLAEVVAGRRDPRAIPEPPAGAGRDADGPADLLARAMWILAQAQPSAITIAAWITSRDPALNDLTPVQWADHADDGERLLQLA